MVLGGERRRGGGLTSAPLERSGASGTARHSLRAAAVSICGGGGRAPSPGLLAGSGSGRAAAIRTEAGRLIPHWQLENQLEPRDEERSVCEHQPCATS